MFGKPACPVTRDLIKIAKIARKMLEKNGANIRGVTVQIPPALFDTAIRELNSIKGAKRIPPFQRELPMLDVMFERADQAPNSANTAAPSIP